MIEINFKWIVELYLSWGTGYLKSGVEIFLEYQEKNGHIRRSNTATYAAQLTEHVKPFLVQLTLLICQHERVGYWQDCFCEGADLRSYLAQDCRAFSLTAHLKGKKVDEILFARYAIEISDAVQQ